MSNESDPVEGSVEVEWDWASTERCFRSGSDIPAELAQELCSSFNDAHGYNSTLAGLRDWPNSYECPFQDLTVYTHENRKTHDVIRVWNYGLGDNDYGTYHFQVAGTDSFMFAKNNDGDISIISPYENVESFPAASEQARDDTLRIVTNLIKWYTALEHSSSLAYEVLGNRCKRMAPSCDPDTWRRLANWD
eukprot:UC4_evm1s1480